jgi:hypothetical protein
MQLSRAKTAHDLLRDFRNRRKQAALEAESLLELRSRDAEENAQSTPPDSEEIRLRAVWVAECYPVSQLDEIIRRLRALTPWNPGLRSSVAGAARTLEDCRTGPYRGGNSGDVIFVPRRSTAFAHADPVRLDLPAAVEWAVGWVNGEVSSLPCLIFRFHLREEATRRVERVLRADYKTYAERHGRWTSYQGPINQKQVAIVEARAQSVRELTAWMGETFPGFFASGGLNGSYPLLEFWTTEKREPFLEMQAEEGQPKTHWDYMELLRWDRPWFREWQSKRLPGLTLRHVEHFHDDRPHGEDYALELVGCTAGISDAESLKMYGGRTPEGLVNHLNYPARDVVSDWALRCALRGYEMQFAATREQLRSASSRKRRREIRHAQALAQTELRLLQLRADIEPALGYMRTEAARAKARDPNPDHFLLVRSLVKGETVSWQRDNIETIDWFAERLAKSILELTEVSTAIVGVLTARVNLRLQRHVRVLTLVAALIAGVALYLQLRS